MAELSQRWHNLEDQQTISTVGLGYVTASPQDPSLAVWPGPLDQPIEIPSQWITHYTNLGFSDRQSTLQTDNKKFSISAFQHGINSGSSAKASEDRKFLSSILITLKLKNPAQYCRELLDYDALLSFVKQFDSKTKFYLVTGCKIARNAYTALQDDEEAGDEYKVELTQKIPVTPVAGTLLAGDVGAHVEHQHATKVIHKVKYRSPGDAIYYVRYAELNFDDRYPGFVILPSPHRTWIERALMLPGKRTYLLCDDTPGVVESPIRFYSTNEPAESATTKLRKMVQGCREDGESSLGRKTPTPPADLAKSVKRASQSTVIVRPSALRSHAERLSSTPPSDRVADVAHEDRELASTPATPQLSIIHAEPSTSRITPQRGPLDG